MFASKIAKLQATSSLFIKYSVVFNGLSIKNNKTWYFIINLPLIFLKIIQPKHIFDYDFIPEKTRRGGFRTWNLKGYWKKQAEIPESIKKEVGFQGVIKKKLCRFYIGLRFLALEFPRGTAQICGISRGESLKQRWNMNFEYFQIQKWMLQTIRA